MSQVKKKRTSNLGKQKLASVTSRPLINIKDFQKKFDSIFSAERDVQELIPLDSIFETNVDIEPKDCIVPSSSQIIEEAIKRHLESRQPNVSSSETPDPPKKKRKDAEEKSQADVTPIPSYLELEAKAKEKLISLTDDGKRETGLMLPRKEVNYVTSQMQKSEKSSEFKDIPSNEVVLVVSLYHSDRNMKTQEYCILASQPLTDLRDALYCLSDHLGSHENLKSGYFFIENTFYNDMRGDNVDYSDKIIAWANENQVYRQSGAWPLYTKKMEEVTLYDLNLRVGEKYLYCHHGNCKHYFIFSEVRMINDQDEKNSNMYPIMTFQSKIRRRKCLICDICSAKWVVWKDKYTSENPTFYCDNCYRQFHYDEKGKLLYDDYEVFRYYHE